MRAIALAVLCLCSVLSSVVHAVRGEEVEGQNGLSWTFALLAIACVIVGV